MLSVRNRMCRVTDCDSKRKGNVVVVSVVVVIVVVVDDYVELISPTEITIDSVRISTDSVRCPVVSICVLSRLHILFNEAWTKGLSLLVRLRIVLVMDIYKSNVYTVFISYLALVHILSFLRALSSGLSHPI